MTKRNIILDCDPGHDDAIALLLSCYSEKINLLAVTTSAGNQTIDKTSKNALNLLNFFNKSDVPLAKGSSHPLEREIQTWQSVQFFEHPFDKFFLCLGILPFAFVLLKDDK